MKTITQRIFSKRNKLILFMVLTSTVAMAEEFQFKFTMGNEVWNHHVSASSKNSALEVASQDCLNHFTYSTGNQKVRVTEDRADALLNTCTNPR